VGAQPVVGYPFAIGQTETLPCCSTAAGFFILRWRAGREGRHPLPPRERGGDDVGRPSIRATGPAAVGT